MTSSERSEPEPAPEPEGGVSRVERSRRGGRRGFAADLRDAVSPRAALLVAGVLVVQLAFVLSYIGAFHAPAPHRVPVAVAAPSAQAGAQVVERVNKLPGTPVDARVVAGPGQARARVLDRSVQAALVIDPQGRSDTLLVATAGGPAGPAAVEQLARRLEGAEKRAITVNDLRPPSRNDARGLSSFYLVLGWMIGGYLAAALLAQAGGARPANLNRMLIRLGTLALYAVVSGLGGALIAGPLFGALNGHFLQLWAIGALVVFAAGASTAAMQILLGTLGIGVAILLYVVLGNPSAGGPYPPELMPAFWRVIGPWLPPGAGTALVRNTVYFHGHATGGPWLVLASYAVAGTMVSIAVSALMRRRRRQRGGHSRARA
ncbi:DUF3533 domain-containing protein [Actinomadura macrotermitis]|uniref:DUF3533 domain-containing protein n=1 Tax=Actinomadura macrotermitis TaxID=2585200 RepID=A0A7K0C5R7_9ACTN|nr:DUF3533 domain-containing protein [Actinomadura macrotermitis]MQY08758.1 hypothetical protein [Actinomadura macrotermitis]